MRWYLLPFYLIDEYFLIILNHIRSYLYHKPPQTWNTGHKGDIVLIQGLHERWIPLKKIADVINQKGYRIHIINELETNTKPVSVCCQLVSEYIIKRDLKEVILVTHSKGGIIGMELLKDPKINQRVKKLISIACPFQGSIFSFFFPYTHELMPSSELIKSLHRGVDIKKVINLFPGIDNHVIPNKNLKLDNCINIQLDIFGHTRILEHGFTIQEIQKLLT